LKFSQLAQRDYAPRLVFIAGYVVIGGTINKKPNCVLAAKPNQFSEGRLNRLSVLEPDYDVRVD
jgi:hypothetical protein